MRNRKNFRIAVIFSFCLLCLVLFSSAAMAEVYKWVDENGTTHFSDQPPEQVPEGSAVETQPDAPPSMYQPPAGETDAETVPEGQSGRGFESVNDSGNKKESETPKKTDNPTVELYVTSWCKYCKQAEAFLQKEGIPYDVFDIEKDEAAARRRSELSPRPGVPLAVINGKVIMGFSETTYRQAMAGDN